MVNPDETLTERLVALLNLETSATEDQIVGAVGRLLGAPASTTSSSKGEMVRQQASLDLDRYFAVGGAAPTSADMSAFDVQSNR
jgi:hypothetical protein